MKVRSVRIQRFKRVKDVTFDLKDLNILVGGNNSGKSTIVQALHFGIGLLQTIQASGVKWPKSGEYPSSLNPSDIIYSPSEDVLALGEGGSLRTNKDQAPRIDYTLDNGETCSIAFFKGKNRNIALTVSNAPVAEKLARLDKPFSVFSPGLAGISKKEGYVSDGVLFRALARGDANLVLRNILLRLWPDEDPPEKRNAWDNFISELQQVFPKVGLKVAFDQDLDEYINVSITTDGANWVPLEIAGTGVLQATQILSYIHRFQPSLMVLDEPDSHLHPNNQRLLCTLLRRVSSERDTQVLLTTHSRHVIDAIGKSSHVLWVKEGSVDVATPDDEIGVLMEIGALDVQERLGHTSTSAAIFTEDDDPTLLKVLAESSGFDLSQTVVQPYYGVTKVHNLRPLISIVRKTNPEMSITVHRDRDFLSAEDVSDWKKSIIKLHAEPFVTSGLDVESHFLNPAYLAEQNPGTSQHAFQKLIDTSLGQDRDDTIEAYVNGKTNISRENRTSGSLNMGALAVQAQKDVTANPRDYSRKKTLRTLRRNFRQSYGIGLKLGASPQILLNDELHQISKRIKKK
jgi:energy-coupling factor transporter ATP-binding protein EcfA2